MLFVAETARKAFVAVTVGLRSMFGYDAADQAGNGRRRPPSRDMRHEDAVLRGTKRTAVQSSARDGARNFSIAAWMVRSHVHYVTRHRFQASSGNDAFDDQLEELVAKLSEPENFDVSGRYCLTEFVALTERAAFVDGDLLWVKLASGHVQGIESDLIRDRTSTDEATEKTTNGVVVDERRGGKHLKYAVHSRNGNASGSYEFQRYVSAANAWLHGYFDRFDQVRGISPLASALNSLRDVYEGVDLSMAKLKAESLFGLKFTREAMEAAGQVLPAARAATDGEGEGEEEVEQGYQVDFGKGPVVLDLDRGDDAEFLQSNSPGANCQEFLKLVIAIVLKAADMPYSFYDESFTNFYGSRAGWLRYDEACVPKRERIQRLLNAWTLWRLTLCVLDGELVVPKGITLSAACWDWIPEGNTWWDPVKDVEGDKSAVMAGFKDAEDLTRKRAGGDIWKNIEKAGRLIKHAQEHGFALSWAPVPQPIQVVEHDPKETK